MRAPLSAETDLYQSPAHGAYRPLGMVLERSDEGLQTWRRVQFRPLFNAFIYTMICSPSPAPAALDGQLAERHAYAATDNIVLDFRARAAQGREYMMGDILEATASPVFHVNIEGTAPIQSIDLIKNGKFVYRAEPHIATAQFDYIDNDAGTPSSAAAPGESRIHFRVIQSNRNLAWSTDLGQVRPEVSTGGQDDVSILPFCGPGARFGFGCRILNASALVCTCSCQLR